MQLKDNESNTDYESNINLPTPCLEKNNQINIVTPLVAAIIKNDITAVNECIANGDDVNQKNLGSSFVKNNTPLMVAAEKGYLEIVKILINKGANINDFNEFGLTPLILAVCAGNLEMVNFLILNKAEIDIVGYKGISALTSAIFIGYTEIAQTLIDARHNNNYPKDIGDTPLWFATRNGFPDIVKILIKENVNLNSTYFDFDITPLMIAACCGNIYMLSPWSRQELEQKNDDLKNSYDVKSSLMIVKMLVEAGAQINNKTKAGDTALMIAVKKGDFEVIDLIIKLKANIDIRNIDGWSALTFAIDRDDAEVVKLLLENDAEISDLDYYKTNDKSQELKKYINSYLYANMLDSFDIDLFKKIKLNQTENIVSKEAMPILDKTLKELKTHITDSLQISNHISTIDEPSNELTEITAELVGTNFLCDNSGCES